MPLSGTIQASLRKGDRCFVARCVELPVVAQGDSEEEAMNNLEEAVKLHLDGEDLEALGLTADPQIQVNMETPANG